MSYASVIGADAPQLWYRFQEKGGTAAFSSGSDSAPLYVMTNPPPILGFTGISADAGAVHLISTSGFLAYPNTQLPANTGYSVEAWFFVQGQGPFGGSSIDLPVQLLWASVTELAIGVSNGNYVGYVRDLNGTGTDVHGSSALTHNAWHHLVGVQHQSSHLKELYVDGSSIGTGTGNTAGLAEAGQLQVRGAGNPAAAIVAEVAVYPYELSAGQAAAHYAAQERFSPPKFSQGLSSCA